MRRVDVLWLTAFAFMAIGGIAAAGSPSIQSPPARAEFIVPPGIVIPHTAEREVIGPALYRRRSGDIILAEPGMWAVPETNRGEEQTRVPTLYLSRDEGRTWQSHGQMNMKWQIPGNIGSGGITLLHLQDGRLAALFHRRVATWFSGGMPAISFSNDEGKTWTPARLLVEGDDKTYYVMNDRMIQLRTGRLIVPVSEMAGTWEGDRDITLCFYSDDGGNKWHKSTKAAVLDAPRGMAEPCVVELKSGRVLMLARTGRGSHHQAESDDGGQTWSTPRPTTLVAACSPLTLHRLPDGRLIVFYNHVKPKFSAAFFPRTPLCYAVSKDEGATWLEPVVIDDTPRQQHIYVGACFLKEGILLAYSSHFARDDGQFGGSPDGRKVGGGKRCIIKYPQ